MAAKKMPAKKTAGKASFHNDDKGNGKGNGKGSKKKNVTGNYLTDDVVKGIITGKTAVKGRKLTPVGRAFSVIGLPAVAASDALAAGVRGAKKVGSGIFKESTYVKTTPPSKKMSPMKTPPKPRTGSKKTTGTSSAKKK